MNGVKSTKINREKLDWLLDQPLEMKLELLSNHMEICRIVINQIMEEEVCGYAGERYDRQRPNNGRYSRWGYNPGSVRVGNQRLRVEVPRVRDNHEGRSISLENYKQLRQLPEQQEELMLAVLQGLSTNDYSSVIAKLSDSFGFSQSSVSRQFIEKSAERLKEFTSRKLDKHKLIAIFLDGKYLAKEQIIIALGVTEQGDKIPLGFIQATTENSKSIKGLFRELIQRGLDYQDGLLFIIDGAKGLRKAIDEVFGEKSIVQRCQWHKRENVVSYLKEEDQRYYRGRLQRAYSLETYKDAKAELQIIRAELEKKNASAANSLDEGLEETLTLHKIGMNQLFSRSFSTTNCIENLNSLIGKYLRKVKHWQNSNGRHRWVASALMEIEQKMRKVDNYKKLYLLKNSITATVNKENEDQSAA